MKKFLPFILLVLTCFSARAQYDSTSFTGIIKYWITTDDPADKDSIVMIFGDHKIRFVMFELGPRGLSVIEKYMIADFNDSSMLTLDTLTKTYKRNALYRNPNEISFELASTKKTTRIMGNTCMEFKGEMKDKSGDVYEAACLVSHEHPYNAVDDYNFLNIHPVIFAGKIVLGFRNKSSEGENTYIMAYSIIRANTEGYFNLTGYKQK
jgi:hypothetical protein